MSDDQIRLVLEGWGDSALAPGHGIATDPALLDPLPPLTLDRYTEYSGPPLPWSWGDWPIGVDGDVVVSLARVPSPEVRSSLERALDAWSEDGVVHGFGIGYLHGFAPGPQWTEATLRWRMDFGSAYVTQAANELARRLAGWSHSSGVQVTTLKFGT